jgi:3-carboxy-cis,cis-muconate cycloisomerase
MIGAGGRAGRHDRRAALLGDPGLRRTLAEAAVTPDQLDAALDPAGYLGAAGQFVDAALAAHQAAAVTPAP